MLRLLVVLSIPMGNDAREVGRDMSERDVPPITIEQARELMNAPGLTCLDTGRIEAYAEAMRRGPFPFNEDDVLTFDPEGVVYVDHLEEPAPLAAPVPDDPRARPADQ